ncbi:ATP-binding SpoIIE family protein phosphatase [Cupriavidus plantarum]|uniref:ATP-binding SpoIIE family protein phosphatase n=1 Tax=Cupriavidus plantarum TaxID=942865 RepID=UPI0015CBA153|nr:ATP-binding SpoIIE family protein phosphatase [Cupriavidus plantarum]NYH98852.1 anti-sigma regulatory factor (Ser/Thr protein kinase) [Cupriavidus plantarum]
MGDPSRVGEARRFAADLASRLAFDAIQSGRLAVVVNELGKNLLRHAVGGRLLIGARTIGDSVAIELVSMDQGPGIADIQACMRDGHSSAGTAGQGLGAIQRMADDFDIHSQHGDGTLVLARFYRERDRSGAPRRLTGFAVGAICLAAPGERASGDGWSVSIGAGTAEVMVADGLGHGPDAAIAADAALAAFDRPRASGPSRFVEQAHAALRGTRGAAIAIAQLDANASRIRFAGAGNVIGRILSGVADRTLLTQNGTAGVQLRTHVQEQETEWPAHALLLVCSDGVQSRWQLEERSLLQRDPALVAAFVIWKFCRGRDDATVVVIRRAES